MGIEDPLHSIEQTRVAFVHAGEYFKAEAECRNGELERMDEKILVDSRDLDATEQRLIQDWNRTPRTIKSLAEAQVAIAKYDEHQNRPFGWRDVLTLALFFAEFLLSYFLFRKFVFEDDGWTNDLICGLIGGVTVFVAYFAKNLPDNTRDPEKYDFRKKVIALLAAVSATLFILCVVVLREFIPAAVTSITEDVVQTGGSKTIWIVFNLSLLSSLIFIAAFLSHLGIRFPRAYLKARYDEGRELLGWYSSDQYKHVQKKEALKDLQESREALYARFLVLKQKAEHFSPRRMPNELRRSCLEFLRGAQTPPLTNSKRRGADKARQWLDSVSSRAFH
jgi:hypothetical protein